MCSEISIAMHSTIQIKLEQSVHTVWPYSMHIELTAQERIDRLKSYESLLHGFATLCLIFD